MLLNLMVMGKGSFTARVVSTKTHLSGKNVDDILMTYPLKNALTQLIINVLGIIMAILFFIMPIMPSIAFGSERGFAGGWPFCCGFFK